jgi:hypothetical protein
MNTTPEKYDTTEVIAELLTDMGLENRPWRRELETSTIEGSPMMLHIRKKIDQKSTPCSFRDADINEILVPTVKQVDHRQHIERESGGDILVLTCGSNIHDTKGHQENMKRTSLIAGNDGCLRREPFENIVCWEESTIDEACMADILR